MMRSMYTGVSGLRVHQTKMDVIANNIANVNTAGYKSSRVTFKDVFSQTMSGAAGANPVTGRGGVNPMQIGLGTGIASIDMLMTPGIAQRTDGAYDLMIEGDGFFILGDGTGRYFSRAGAFRLDVEGNLTNYSGMMVMGWDAVPVTGKPGQYAIEKKEVQPIKLGGDKMYIAPEMSTGITFEGNICLDDLLDGEKESTISFYDSLGNNYTMKVQYKYNSTTKAWDMSVGNYMYLNGDTSKGVRVEVSLGTADTTHDNSSTTGLYNLTFETVDDSTPPTAPWQALEVSAGNSISVIFDKNGYVISDAAAYTAAYGGTVPTGLMKGFNVKIDDAFEALDPRAQFSASGVEVDFSKLTQFNGTTDAQAYTLDGGTSGTLEGVSIGSDGKIYGRYSNGRTKLLAQVAIAKFKNPAGLEKVGDSMFVETANSGKFDGIGSEASGILGGNLEMANVDLGMEFTEMITTQRGFQANSRIISTSDEMLQELVNLKR